MRLIRSTKSSKTLKSFKELKAVREKWESRPIKPLHTDAVFPCQEGESIYDDDEAFFQQAMSDVRPLERDEPDTYVEKRIQTKRPREPKNNEETAGVEELTRLLEYGEGFVVANMPEYIEGTGYNVAPGVARRLHRGEFAIEAFIDLHGCTVDAAWEVFNTFLMESLRSGKRAVLIVHGRGLSSPQRPVLKDKVSEWLTRGPWRKWVIAFSSAPAYDGGVGATYVLLRKQPATKRLRKKSRIME